MQRYLGINWDERASFERHWHGVHDSSKRLTYELHRGFGRHVPPELFADIWRQRVEPVLSWAFPWTGPKLRASVVEVEGVTKHAAHFVHRSDLRSSYAAVMKSLRYEPMWRRLLVWELEYIYACYVRICRCALISSAIVTRPPLRCSQRLQAQTTSPMQVHIPSTPLASVRDLPLLRSPGARVLERVGVGGKRGGEAGRVFR